MKQNIIRIGALILLLAVFFAGAAAFTTGFFGLFPQTAEGYAKRIIATCAHNAYPPSCYDEEVPRLMDRGLTMEEAFDVTRAIEENLDTHFYCHVLGHRLAAKETAKDPSQWTEVIARCPSGICSTGCLHGAAQERYRSDTLSKEEVAEILPRLAEVCTPGVVRDFTPHEEASCYHSLGHLAMYVTGADVPRALQVCDTVSGKGTHYDFSRTCYEGLFMQVFQPLEPEDVALVKHLAAGTKEEAKVFCSSFEGEKQGACHRESAVLYGESLQDPDTLKEFCSFTPGAYYVRVCYSVMFYFFALQTNFDADRLEAICLNFSGDLQGFCFKSIVARYIETDETLVKDALAFCARAPQGEVRDGCYENLLFGSYYNFTPGSDAFVSLCNGLPEPLSTRCFAGDMDMPWETKPI